jgi:hypothetical protein
VENTSATVESGQSCTRKAAAEREGEREPTTGGACSRGTRAQSIERPFCSLSAGSVYCNSLFLFTTTGSSLSLSLHCFLRLDWLSLSLSRRKVFDGKWKGRLYGGKRNRIPHEVARNIMWPGGRNGPKRPSLPQERRPKQRGTPSLEISHSSPRLTFLTHNVDVGLDVVRVAHENREWRRNFKFKPNSNSFPKNILPCSFLLIAG